MMKVFIFVFPFLVLVSFTLCTVLLCLVSCVESKPLPLLAMSSVVIGLSPSSSFPFVVCFEWIFWSLMMSFFSCHVISPSNCFSVCVSLFPSIASSLVGYCCIIICYCPFCCCVLLLLTQSAIIWCFYCAYHYRSVPLPELQYLFLYCIITSRILHHNISLFGCFLILWCDPVLRLICFVFLCNMSHLHLLLCFLLLGHLSVGLSVSVDLSLSMYQTPVSTASLFIHWSSIAQDTYHSIAPPSHLLCFVCLACFALPLYCTSWIVQSLSLCVINFYCTLSHHRL